MAEIKPVTPDEIAETKRLIFPNGIIEIFNELIAAHYDGLSSIVLQNEAVCLIEDRFGYSRAEIYNKDYLNIEPLYEAAGWNVEYDKPAYNESYPAKYIFKKK